jgi:hypothetical protein
MTDWRERCAELADRLDDALTYTVQSDTERSMRQLIARTRAELAQSEPEALTVQECNDMRKHRENYIYEYCDGDIELDGCFSREDLLELARTIPANPRPPES